MPLLLEWDPRKAVSNCRKHGVRFEEASTVFGDRLSITVPDVNHEERWITVQESTEGKILVSVHTDSNTSIRLISARAATRAERKQYEEGD